MTSSMVEVPEGRANRALAWAHENKTILGVVYLVAWVVTWSYWPDYAEGLDRLGWVLIAAGIIDGDVIARARRFGTQTERNPLRPQRAKRAQ